MEINLQSRKVRLVSWAYVATARLRIVFTEFNPLRRLFFHHTTHDLWKLVRHITVVYSATNRLRIFRFELTFLRVKMRWRRKCDSKFQFVHFRFHDYVWEISVEFWFAAVGISGNIIYLYVNTNLYSVELRWLTECLAEFLRLHNSSLTDSTLQSKLTEFDLKVFRVAINSTQRKVKRYEMTFNINQTRNVSITSHRILKSNKSLVEREKREESQQQLQFIWLHFALHKKEAELKWKHAAFLRGWKITTDFISNEINDRKKY